MVRAKKAASRPPGKRKRSEALTLSIAPRRRHELPDSQRLAFENGSAAWGRSGLANPVWWWVCFGLARAWGGGTGDVTDWWLTPSIHVRGVGVPKYYIGGYEYLWTGLGISWFLSGRLHPISTVWGTLEPLVHIVYSTIGNYDTDFPNTQQYEQLLINFLLGATAKELGSTWGEGGAMSQALPRLHFDVTGSEVCACYHCSFITGRVDNTGVVGWQELLFLYSMTEHRPIHLGYMLADFIAHQGQYVRLCMIFSGPYIM